MSTCHNRIDLSIYVNIQICRYMICRHTSTDLCVDIYQQIPTDLCVDICLQIYMIMTCRHISTDLCVYMSIHMSCCNFSRDLFRNIYAYTCAYVHIYIYIYACICTHTYI